MSEDNAWKVVALALSRVDYLGVIHSYEKVLDRLTTKLRTTQTDLEYERARLTDTQDAVQKEIGELKATIQNFRRALSEVTEDRTKAEKELQQAKELASEYDQEFLLRRSSEESWRKKANEEADIADQRRALLEEKNLEIQSLVSQIESLNGEIDQLSADKAALCEAIKEAASAPPNATLLAPR
jgi:chromosome segregation ATPase